MIVRLTEKHFKKLAVITDLPLEEVVKLNSMGLIDCDRAVALLMKYDWKLLLSNASAYSAQQRVEAIMNEYNVTEHRVRETVYGNRSMEYYCKECGRKITKTESLKNRGYCHKCTVKQIKL